MVQSFPWQEFGVMMGGIISGLALGIFWIARNLNRTKPASSQEPPAVSREEFRMGMTELRTRLGEAAKEASDARTAATAAQGGLDAIGHMIETSIRSLGDRLEGALRDTKERVDDHAELITDHHGRLRSVETELRIIRHDHT
jgi:uncharacterized membrane protein